VNIIEYKYGDKTRREASGSVLSLFFIGISMHDLIEAIIKKDPAFESFITNETIIKIS
jgi:hypothetical protein